MSNTWWSKNAGQTAAATNGMIAPAELRAALYGAEAHRLSAEVAAHRNLTLVEDDPDVVICYGGDGTLLGAEMRWPGAPKVPILNSRRGHRCIAHPADEVIGRLAGGTLIPHEYLTLEGAVVRGGATGAETRVRALNEFNVHMGRINSAVRFKLWFEEQPYEDGLEILGDGLVVSTPFGSTAYFNQITRGIFTHGIGVALKYTGEHTNHMVVPESMSLRVLITRGPATLAYDSADEFVHLEEGDALLVRRHAIPAIILHCDARRPIAEHF